MVCLSYMRRHRSQIYSFKSTIFKKTPKYSTFRTLSTLHTSSSVFECFAKVTFAEICVCSMNILLVSFSMLCPAICPIAAVYGADVTVTLCIWTPNQNIFTVCWWIWGEWLASLAHGQSWLHCYRKDFHCWWSFDLFSYI